MIVKPAIRYLTRAPDAEIIVRVQAALAGIGKNPAIFKNPTPTLAAVQAALDAFIAAVGAAALGGPAQTAIRKSKRVELAGLVRLLSVYVDETANGDMSVLLLSGLPHHKPTRSRIGRPLKPATPQLRRGPKSGSLRAAVAPVYGAGSYNWRVAAASAPDDYVQTTQTIGGRVGFDGLIAGEVYSVSASAVGAAGASDWSEVGTIRIL